MPESKIPAEGVEATLGDAGHRWMTALGSISGNEVLMNVKTTSGGLFDTPTEITRVNDGTIILTFHDCNSGTVIYDIPSINKTGTVPIERVAVDNVALCEALIETSN